MPKAEFGRGYDVSNLRYLRLFIEQFLIRDALRHESSWDSLPHAPPDTGSKIR